MINYRSFKEGVRGRATEGSRGHTSTKCDECCRRNLCYYCEQVANLMLVQYIRWWRGIGPLSGSKWTQEEVWCILWTLLCLNHDHCQVFTSFISSIDFSTSNDVNADGIYEVQVSACDTHCNSQCDTLDLQVVTNRAPTDITLSSNSIDENQIIWTIVWSLESVDINTADNHNYSFIYYTNYYANRRGQKPTETCV